MAYKVKNELEQLPNLTDHSFLGELLLQPFVNRTDGSRSMMFTSVVPQMLELVTPEVPLVFTRFENQVGAKSRGLRKQEKGDFEIDLVFKRNEFETVALGYNTHSERIDAIVQTGMDTLTESYCTTNVRLPLSENMTLKEGSIYQHSTSFDDCGNLMYGINVKVAFLPWKGLTFEDAIVISESLQQRLTHNYLHTVFISLNNNDVLTTGLLKVGDVVKNSVLGIRRRISYASGLAALNTKAFGEELIPDVVFKCSGEVVDVKIYSNTTIEKLSENEFNKDIVELLIEQTKFYEQLKNSLKAEIDEGGYTDKVAELYMEACHFTDPDYRWTFENSEFDSVLIEIKVKKETVATKGSKISGRYGNKGVVSAVLPTEEMPMDEYGVRVEACQNPGGVPNRLNISQNFEMEICHISAYFIREYSHLKGYEFIEQYAQNCLSYINADQSNSLLEFAKNLSGGDVAIFVEEIKQNGFSICQPPFFDNIGLEVLERFYDEGHGIPKPLIFADGTRSVLPVMVADMYLSKLKHESSSKFSARSAQYVGIKGIPTKNNRDFKSFQANYSNTPIRIGEQELFNLFLAMDYDSTYNYLKMMSSNRENRQQLVKAFLTHPDIGSIDDLVLEDTPSLTGLVCRSYLSAAGIELVE